MKRTLLFSIAALLCTCTASAYDFMAIAPSGQSLYYEIISSTNHTARLVAPHYASGSYIHYNWAQFQKPVGDVVIPATVQDLYGTTYNVTEIGTAAFINCNDITSVEIPYGVTKIGDWAFYYCINAISIDIPSSVTNIGHYALCACHRLTNVEIPNSVTNIGRDAFATDTSLMNIVIPNSVTQLGSEAFAGCKHLISVTLSNSLTVLDSNVFSGCWRLTEINIPSSINRIRYCAFNCCYSLFNLVVPNTVTHIQQAAFLYVVNVEYHGSASEPSPNGWGQRCKNGYIEDSVCYTNSSKHYVAGIHRAAQSVTLPSCVETIKDNFLSFTELERLKMEASYPPTFNITDTYTGTHNVFNYTNPNLEVIVPCEATHTYMSAQYWNTQNIVGEFDYDVQVGVNNSSMGYVNIISSPSCDNSHLIMEAIPYSGYKFTSWSDNNTESLRNITVTDDIHITANFSIENQVYNITATTADPTMGTVTGSGQYNTGDTVTLTAFPNAGYLFDHWQDGNTDNPREIIATEDAIYVAFFTQGQGIGDVVSDGIDVCAEKGCIVVKSNGQYEGCPVQVFDMMGRLLSNLKIQSSKSEFLVPGTGVYFVSVGKNYTRKIVVIR